MENMQNQIVLKQSMKKRRNEIRTVVNNKGVCNNAIINLSYKKPLYRCF